MGIFRRKKKESKEDELVLAMVIRNPVSSEIFQDILNENRIPFLCRQNGADGYVRLLFGSGIVPDNIYVEAKNCDRVRELYDAYFNTEVEPEE